MRRRTFLAGLLAVPVAVACDPVRGVSQVPVPGPAPQGGFDDVGQMSTAGFAGLVAGEDWHYVGDAGEPAFQNSWVNLGSGYPHMAFRVRESGTIDVAGVVTGGTGIIFYLPTGYRPSAMVFFACTGETASAADAVGRFTVRNSDGGVIAVRDGANQLTTVYAHGQFFVNAPVDT